MRSSTFPSLLGGLNRLHQKILSRQSGIPAVQKKDPASVEIKFFIFIWSTKVIKSISQQNETEFLPSKPGSRNYCLRRWLNNQLRTRLANHFIDRDKNFTWVISCIITRCCIFTQQTFICLKPTIETLIKGVKYVQS